MKMHVNRIFRIAAALLPLLGAGCSDSDGGPGKPLEITLSSQTLELERSETGCLRFALTPWNDAWSVSRVEITAAPGGSFSSGCTVTGWSGPVGGQFSLFVTDPATGQAYDEQVCLTVEVGGQRMTSEPFTLRSSPAAAAELPVIYVTASAPVEDTDTWIAGAIRIEGNGGFDDLPEMATEVKGRGNSTWNWEKKPYALKLSKKTEILGMPEHKRWCLIANYMDRTLMRNRVAHYVASHTSLQWTPRTRFAEVWFNGEYLGNYLVVEQIKIDENRLNIDELTTDDNEGDALTGGYLLEMDTYFDEMNKFRSSSSDMPVNIKSPDESITAAQFRYIRTYFNEADNLLFDKDYRDPAAMFDIGSFVDYWIINELMGNQEIKHPKSFYIHKPRGGKLTAGPIWDFDYGTLTLADAEKWMVRETSMWYSRLFQSRAIRRQARERWEALYPFLATVPDYIEAQRDYISDSAHRNLARWPEIKISDAEVQLPNGDELLTFDEAVDRLKASYSMRLAWLDAQIRSW